MKQLRLKLRQMIIHCNIIFDCRVGVTEKGSLTLELSVAGSPGHSSVPPASTAIGILATAVSKLEDHQQPIMFGEGPEAATLQYIAPYVSIN